MFIILFILAVVIIGVIVYFAVRADSKHKSLVELGDKNLPTVSGDQNLPAVSEDKNLPTEQN